MTYVVQLIIPGDLIFVRNLDEEIVVVNSQHIAEALLDKRSRIYSDRPYLATLEPCVPSILLYSIESEVSADMACRSTLDSYVMVMNGVSADDSSTKLSVLNPQ